MTRSFRSLFVAGALAVPLSFSPRLARAGEDDEAPAPDVEQPESDKPEGDKTAPSPATRGDDTPTTVVPTEKQLGAPRAGRPHPGRRRAPEQPQGLRSADPAARVHGRERSVGLGEVEPRLRHALRRGPPPLRRDLLALRAAVPRAHGQAALRAHRR